MNTKVYLIPGRLMWGARNFLLIEPCGQAYVLGYQFENKNVQYACPCCMFRSEREQLIQLVQKKLRQGELVGKVKWVYSDEEPTSELKVALLADGPMPEELFQVECVTLSAEALSALHREAKSRSV